jgi:hypothetical protein
LPFLWAPFSKETVLVLAGFAAHRGHLDLPRVITMAMFAGWLNRPVVFLFRPLLRPAASPLLSFAQAARRTGGNTFAPLSSGAHSRDPLHVWATYSRSYRVRNGLGGLDAVSTAQPARYSDLGPAHHGAGYLFGEAVELILQDVARYERYALAAIVLFGLGAWAWHRWRGK